MKTTSLAKIICSATTSPHAGDFARGQVPSTAWLRYSEIFMDIFGSTDIPLFEICWGINNYINPKNSRVYDDINKP